MSTTTTATDRMTAVRRLVNDKMPEGERAWALKALGVEPPLTPADPFEELDDALAEARTLSRLVLRAIRAHDVAELERLTELRHANSAEIDRLLIATSPEVAR